MGTIVQLNFTQTTVDSQAAIDINELYKSKRAIAEGLIAPAVEDTSYAVAEDHASDPIKDIKTIERISDWLISQGRYRDNMLFIVGINFGLRVSDLLTLRFSHLINTDFTFKTTFPILEKKTKNTRKVQKNRYVSVNDAVIDAIILYLSNTEGVTLSDYMFRSASNNGSNVNKPMHRNSVERLLKSIGKELGLTEHIATHTLRKTFGYHQMLISGNDPRKLLLLQKIFGHSSSAQTLQYIGITGEEIEQAYLDLNLGSGDRYLVDSKVYETDEAITVTA